MKKHRCTYDWLSFVLVLLFLLPSSLATHTVVDYSEDFTEIGDWSTGVGQIIIQNGTATGNNAGGSIIYRTFDFSNLTSYNISYTWYYTGASNYIVVGYYNALPLNAYKTGVLENIGGDVVALYTGGSSDSSSAFDYNLNTLYRVNYMIWNNGTQSVYINDVLRHQDTTRDLNGDDDYFYFMLRDDETEFFDNLTIGHFVNPSLILNTNFVNNTNVTNYQTHSIPITYNGTITDTSDIFNCSFFNNTNLIERDLNVNLSQLQYFTLNTSNFTGYYSKLVIDCNNTETSFATAGYRYNIDTVFTLTYTEQALTDINANLTLIYEVLEMIPIVILYLGLLYFSYWLMQTGNTLVGWFVYFTTVGFDFLISGLLYDSYFSLIDDSIRGMLVTGFFVFLVAWIGIKFLSLSIIKARTKFI